MRTIKIHDALFNKLHLTVFDRVKKIKGVIQVLHGVNEHGLRYKEFGEWMNQQGYVVYVHDHKAQGNSRVMKDGNVVNFGYRGNDVLIDGMRAVRKKIQEDYPNQKVYALGHSLGSLIIRNYLYKHQNHYEKIIMSGTGYQNPKGIGLMIFIGNFLKLFGNKPSKLFDNVFRKTQLRLNEKTDIGHFIEWLTRDTEKTAINKVDEYLYIRLTVSSFVDILKLVKKANNKKLIEKHYKDLNFLLFSGTHDPSTEWGEATVELHSLLTSMGNKSKHILYEEGRHDNLQEINRLEVFQDVLNFIENAQ